MWNEEKLDKMLSTPSAALIEDIKKIDGDIMILGAGGKMGPSLCLLAQNAVKAAVINKRIITVSRFTDEISTKLLTDNGIEIIKCDLQNSAELNALPDVKNIIYMAGRKFGTDGNEWQTWGMNSVLPALVCEKFKKSSIVVFSSGNIYPLVPITSGGGSDAAYSVIAGVPTVCGIGTTGDFCHTADEYSDIDSLEKRAKLMSLTILEN